MKQVDQLPSDSIIFYTFYSGVRNDAFYEFDESISLIWAHSKVPVHGAWDFNLGYGIVGGRLTSGFDHGRLAGEMALRVLKGEHIENIPIVRRSPTRYMFDYRAMQRFGIKLADLPKDSVIINEPASFYQVNKSMVWGIIAGFIFLSSTIILLLMNIRRRKAAEVSLREEIEQRKLAQSELQKSRDELELRVHERTADLAQANQQLVCEIAERKQAEQMLKELSEKDHLTNMFNRRKLLEHLGSEIEKSKRYKRPLSLILFDFDHFKKVNDTFGHDIGDMVLTTTKDIVCGAVRKADICARYGGEEFIIVAPETNIDGASALAEKLRLAIENHTYATVGKMTISAGVAEFIPGDCESTFIKRADEALYNAKEAGRNRVEIARAERQP